MTSPSLGSIALRPSLRPDLTSTRPSRAGPVNDGRRPPPQAARSVIDRPEHGGRIAESTLDGSETINTVALPQAGEVIEDGAAECLPSLTGSVIIPN
jgi:hypothetical protein